MTPAIIIAELEAIETKCRAVRLEIGIARATRSKETCRAFVEADAARLLKHAARLYAEACRVKTEERNEPSR